MEKSADQILRELKNKQYQAIYFLCGEEPYYIDQISNYIQENVLNETEKTFNQTIVYGKDSDAVAVMNAAKRFPMMSEYQVVIVKEAQEMQRMEDLIHYVENPLRSTILVLNYKYKTPDKRKKIFKTIQKNSEFFTSKKMYDNQVPIWISSYIRGKKYDIDPKASAMLVEFLGSDLAKISNEIDKLILTLDEGSKTITANHIERNIGISKDYNNFELQKAMGMRDVLKANRIINYFAENQKNYPTVLTINSLYSYFSKLLIYYWITDKSEANLLREMGIGHKFFLKEYLTAVRKYNANQLIRIISILREYDLKSKGYKGVAIQAGDLLKELIFKILHA